MVLTLGQVNRMSLKEALRAQAGIGALPVLRGQPPRKSSAPASVPSSATPTSTTANAPAAILQSVVTANNRIAALIAPFGPVIDSIPAPPYYRSFNADFKVRPIDALITLLNPLEWLMFDTVNEANRASGVAVRRIGVPGIMQVDFPMDMDVPSNWDPTYKTYLRRLKLIENAMILAYQDPKNLAIGMVRALVNALRAGRISAAQQAAFATGILQAAAGKNLPLAAPGVQLTVPTFRFLREMVLQLQSAMPGLRILQDARAAVQAGLDAARQAAAQGQAAAADMARQASEQANKLAKIVDAVNRFNRLVVSLGPVNAGLVREIYTNGDQALKNNADAVKTNAQRLLGDYADLPGGLRSILDQIVSASEQIKNNASDLMGYKNNGNNAASAAVHAARYSPDSAGVIVTPQAFAGYGADSMSYRMLRGFGVVGADDAVEAGTVAEADAATGTGAATVATTGEAAAPAATPEIAKVIAEILRIVSANPQLVSQATSLIGVGGPASIKSQPTNVTVSAGQPATLSVSAEGLPPLKYQWQGQLPGRDWQDIPSATSASYTSPPDRTPGTMYRVKVSNTLSPGGTVSNAVGITGGGGGLFSPGGKKPNWLPYVLGAGALVALPVAGPVAALALGAGALATSIKKKPGSGVAGLGNAHLASLGAAAGEDQTHSREYKVDALSDVAAGRVHIKARNWGSAVVQAKDLLRSAGLSASSGDVWSADDQNAVAQFQRQAGLPVTTYFDAATLAALRSMSGGSSRSSDNSTLLYGGAVLGAGLLAWSLSGSKKR